MPGKARERYIFHVMAYVFFLNAQKIEKFHFRFLFCFKLITCFFLKYITFLFSNFLKCPILPDPANGKNGVFQKFRPEKVGHLKKRDQF